jgi:hypothetical protein
MKESKHFTKKKASITSRKDVLNAEQQEKNSNIREAETGIKRKIFTLIIWKLKRRPSLSSRLSAKVFCYREDPWARGPGLKTFSLIRG